LIPTNAATSAAEAATQAIIRRIARFRRAFIGFGDLSESVVGVFAGGKRALGKSTSSRRGLRATKKPQGGGP
jgi:hypothetical protein